MLDGIDEDAVDFRATYDGEDQEPVVLPARFPEPAGQRRRGHRGRHGDQHPAAQCRRIVRRAAAADRRIQPAAIEALHAHIPGPDFPTGGVLVEPAENIRQAYETGRGSFRLRARWEKEALGHGAYQIVVTEMPYQVPKGRLIEKIAALLEEKKLPLLADIRDESTEDVRLVLEPKTRNVDAEMLMEQLFRADRARSPGAAQPQRARSRRRAAGDEPEGGVAGLSRPSPRGAAAAQPPSPRRGRPPHRDPARPDHRLPQSRRGDPDHPRRRRPESRR